MAQPTGDGPSWSYLSGLSSATVSCRELKMLVELRFQLLRRGEQLERNLARDLHDVGFFRYVYDCVDVNIRISKETTRFT